MSDEPEYVENVDEMIARSYERKARPKWATPKPGTLEESILKAANRKFYKDRVEYRAVRAITKVAISLALMPNRDKNRYPIEWVEDCIRRANWMRTEEAYHRFHRRFNPGLEWVLKQINDFQKREEFCMRWLATHKDQGVPNLSDEETESGYQNFDD